MLRLCSPIVCSRLACVSVLWTICVSSWHFPGHDSSYPFCKDVFLIIRKKERNQKPRWLGCVLEFKESTRFTCFINTSPCLSVWWLSYYTWWREQKCVCACVRVDPDVTLFVLISPWFCFYRAVCEMFPVDLSLLCPLSLLFHLSFLTVPTCSLSPVSILTTEAKFNADINVEKLKLATQHSENHEVEQKEEKDPKVKLWPCWIEDHN